MRTRHGTTEHPSRCTIHGGGRHPPNKLSSTHFCVILSLWNACERGAGQAGAPWMVFRALRRAGPQRALLDPAPKLYVQPMENSN